MGPPSITHIVPSLLLSHSLLGARLSRCVKLYLYSISIYLSLSLSLSLSLIVSRIANIPPFRPPPLVYILALARATPLGRMYIPCVLYRGGGGGSAPAIHITNHRSYTHSRSLSLFLSAQARAAGLVLSIAPTARGANRLFNYSIEDKTQI